MIHLDHISKRYVGRGGTVDALKDVSVHVEKGDIYGIIGFSGAGKSTLIRMVNRLETPDSGTVTVDGHRLAGLSKAELRQVRRKIGMVFQQFNLLDSKTVFQNVAIPLILEGASKEKITARVKKVLRFVELEDKRDTYVSQLSGGQKQRVGIARALATEPAILLCDEATSALAPQTTESILQLLKRVNREMGVICFVPDGDYTGFMEQYTGKHYVPGAFIDLNGAIVGRHRGAVRYTLGQRKGLGLAMGSPVYVCGKDMQANTVSVGPESALYSKSLLAEEMNWIAFPRLDGPLRVKAKTRYRQTEQAATVYPEGERRIRLEFDEPQRAVTVGQAVVLYDGDTVVGGGTICETGKEGEKPC